MTRARTAERGARGRPPQPALEALEFVVRASASTTIYNNPHSALQQYRYESALYVYGCSTCPTWRWSTFAQRMRHAGAKGCRLVASILLHTPSADTRRHMYAQRPPSVRPAAWSSSSCAQLQHCSMWSMMWSSQQLVSYIVHTGPPAAAAAEQQHLVTMLRLTAPRAAPWTLHFRAGAAWSPVCACTPPDGRWSPAHHPSPSTLHPPCAVCVPPASRDPAHGSARVPQQSLLLHPACIMRTCRRCSRTWSSALNSGGAHE